VMSAHTSQQRAAEFEREVELALHGGRLTLANSEALS
jgi:hypothetical protein